MFVLLARLGKPPDAVADRKDGQGWPLTLPPTTQPTVVGCVPRNQYQSTTLPFKESAIVRHRLRPEWGAGRVLLRTEEYLQIDFSAGGLKKLKTSIADEHLEAATDAESRALKPQKTKETVKRTVTPKTRLV